MTVLTLEQLAALCPPTPRARLELFVEPLNAALAEFAIDTLARGCAFLAQVAHESGGFHYLRELASGAAYEGNAHLGNTEAGDGPRYRGRGLIQITGRKNYTLAAEALGLPLLEQPELLEEPIHACRSAGWFWTVGAGLNLSRRALAYGVPAFVNLNELADRGDFEGITLAVNGGFNGYEDRLGYFRRAQAVLA
jgi:putative chitinase